MKAHIDDLFVTASATDETDTNTEKDISQLPTISNFLEEQFLKLFCQISIGRIG